MFNKIRQLFGKPDESNVDEPMSGDGYVIIKNNKGTPESKSGFIIVDKNTGKMIGPNFREGRSYADVKGNPSLIPALLAEVELYQYFEDKGFKPIFLHNVKPEYPILGSLGDDGIIALGDFGDPIKKIKLLIKDGWKFESTVTFFVEKSRPDYKQTINKKGVTFKFVKYELGNLRG